MESIKTENDLTTRQWEVYKLLKDVYKMDQNRFLSNKEIYKALKEHYPKLKEDTYWNNQTARRNITDDILALKKSKVVQVIILSTPRGSKIATESEIAELEKRKISLLKSLKIVYSQLDKGKLDGQKRLVLNQEKEYIETFLKEEAV